MVVVTIFLLFLIALLLWILLAPIQLILRSEEGILMVRLVSIGSAAIIFENNTFLLKFQGFFISKTIPFNEMRRKEKEKEKTGVKKKKDKSFRMSKRKRKWIFRLLRLPSSFRIKVLYTNFDSGDHIFNAYMYPVFGLLHNFIPNWSWSVNYFGRNQIDLVLQTSLIRMIYVYLK